MGKNNQKISVPIKGMHCKSCEILIEENLEELKGVKKAKANYHRNLVELYFNGEEPDSELINEAVLKAGYAVGVEEKKGLFSKNVSDYKELGIAFVILVGGYYMLKGLGITDINFNTSGDNLTVTVVLLVGLTAGISTCMALIGGLVLGLSAKHNELHPEATTMEKFRPHLFFNLGRILSYAFFGGLLGILGSAIQLSAFALGILTIMIGILMLIMGMQLIEIFPWAQKIKFVVPKVIGKKLGLNKHNREYSHKNSMVLGAITFFLPCGFTQAMQVLAVASGNFFSGMAIMALFAIGTLPGLLGVGGLVSAVKGSFSRKFFKLAGLIVIAFAIFNMSNGMGLTGWDFVSATAPTTVAVNDPNVTMENGVQVVRMKETNRGYEPSSFTIKKGIPVKWVIDAQAPYLCASSLIMSKYKIRKNLKAGENIIEFTPTETGRLKFSCSMGMYTGYFDVVDESGKPVSVVNTVNASEKDATPSGSCGASGGGGGCGCGGGGATIQKDATETVAVKKGDVQEISSVYTASKYIQPNAFKVKVGTKVKFNIDVRDSGRGCGYEIMIPGLYDDPIQLVAEKPITMEFIPKSKGTFDITCGMEMIRYGTITVE